MPSKFTNVYRHSLVGMPWEWPWTWSVVENDCVVAKGVTMTERGAKRAAARHSK